MNGPGGPSGPPLLLGALFVGVVVAGVGVLGGTPLRSATFTSGTSLIDQMVATAAAGGTGGRPAPNTGDTGYCLSSTGGEKPQGSIETKCMRGCTYQLNEGGGGGGLSLEVTSAPPVGLNPYQQANLPPGKVIYQTFYEGTQFHTCDQLGHQTLGSITGLQNARDGGLTLNGAPKYSGGVSLVPSTPSLSVPPPALPYSQTIGGAFTATGPPTPLMPQQYVEDPRVTNPENYSPSSNSVPPPPPPKPPVPASFYTNQPEWATAWGQMYDTPPPAPSPPPPLPWSKTQEGQMWNQTLGGGTFFQPSGGGTSGLPTAPSAPSWHWSPNLSSFGGRGCVLFFCLF